MARRAIRVAKGELEILRMLWEEGPLTIGDAHRAYRSFGNPISYPTMQTRLNRMVEKKLLARSGDRPARYRAAATRDQVTRGHFQELLASLGGGDVVPLVAHLLSDQTLTESQVAELRQLLDEASRQGKSASRKRRGS